MKHLLTPVTVGALSLNNRIAMAPLTRARSGTDGVPTGANALYYGQRATAGLIISEATNVSTRSAAFELAPGIHNAAQVAGWKRVADAIHADGGKLFVQLWHSGRVSASALLDGQEPLSPSGVNDDLGALQVYAALRNGAYARIAASPSRAMTEDEIHAVVREFRAGAVNALAAGADGVELHAANGYLIQQFLSSAVNRRDDAYGGSVENRARLLREIVVALLEVMPAGRIGVRLSPFARYNNAQDADTAATYIHVAKMLQEFGVAYIHAADTNAWGGEAQLTQILALIRPHFKGAVIANAGLTPEAAEALVAGGQVDLVAFGRQYVANPDLVARIAQDGPYNTPDVATFYGGDARGYTDYPALA